MEMTRFRSALILFAVAVLLLTGQAWAQNPTGTLTGRVNDEDGGALPGVTVTAESDSLQGTRSTTTEGNGGYKLAFLPPGVYTVSYALEGFNSAVREVKISAARTSSSSRGRSSSATRPSTSSRGRSSSTTTTTTTTATRPSTTTRTTASSVFICQAFLSSRSNRWTMVIRVDWNKQRAKRYRSKQYGVSKDLVLSSTNKRS